MSLVCRLVPAIQMTKNKRINGIKGLALSFKHAFVGIFDAIRLERNMRIHVAATFYVITAALLTGVTGAEMAVLLLAIGMVMALEMVNTAIEKLCDFTEKGYSKNIKLIKDISAGAVLIVAIISIAVGISVLANEKLISVLTWVASTPHMLILFIASLLLSWVFIHFGLPGFKQAIGKDVMESTKNKVNSDIKKKN